MAVCYVSLLDETKIEISVDKNDKGREIVDKVCQHLNIIEKDYFGLKLHDKALQDVWINPDKALRKQFPTWKGLLNLKFGVRYYPTDPFFLKEEISKYHICLQIRDDLMKGKLPCSLDTLAILSSYWLQSEFGDGDEQSAEVKQCLASLRSISDKFSSSTFETLVLKKYASRKGMPAADADTQFLRYASALPLYGVQRYSAQDERGTDVEVGVGSAGITEISSKHGPATFKWRRIKNLNYKKKEFYLKLLSTSKSRQSSIKNYKLNSDVMAKALWQDAVNHHVFFRVTASDGSSDRGSVTGDKGKKLGKKRSLSSRFSFRRKRAKTEVEVREESAKIKRPNPEVVRQGSLRKPTSPLSEISTGNEKESSDESTTAATSDEDDEPASPSSTNQEAERKSEWTPESSLKEDAPSTKQASGPQDVSSLNLRNSSTLLLTETIPEEDEPESVDHSVDLGSPGTPAVATHDSTQRDVTSSDVESRDGLVFHELRTDASPVEGKSDGREVIFSSDHVLATKPEVQKIIENVDASEERANKPLMDCSQRGTTANLPTHDPESKDYSLNIDDEGMVQAVQWETLQEQPPPTNVVEAIALIHSEKHTGLTVKQELEANILECGSDDIEDEAVFLETVRSDDPATQLQKRGDINEEDKEEDAKTIGATSDVAVLGDDNRSIKDFVDDSMAEREIETNSASTSPSGKRSNSANSEIVPSIRSSASDLTDNTEELCNPNILDIIWSKCLRAEKDGDIYFQLFGVRLRKTGKKLAKQCEISELEPSSRRTIGVQVPDISDQHKDVFQSRRFIPSWPFHPDSPAAAIVLDELDRDVILSALRAQADTDCLDAITNNGPFRTQRKQSDLDAAGKEEPLSASIVPADEQLGMSSVSQEASRIAELETTSGRSTPSSYSSSAASESSFPRFVHSVYPLRKSSTSSERNSDSLRKQNKAVDMKSCEEDSTTLPDVNPLEGSGSQEEPPSLDEAGDILENDSATDRRLEEKDVITHEEEDVITHEEEDVITHEEEKTSDSSRSLQEQPESDDSSENQGTYMTSECKNDQVADGERSTDEEEPCRNDDA